MLKLPNVTAVCMQGYGPDKNLLYRDISNRLKRAIPYMLKFFEFKEIVLIAPEDLGIEGLTYIHTNPLTYDEYNTWCLHSLSDYVNTDYCILFQDDGFPINPNNWRDEFLQYDYVGAPITKDMGILYREEMIGGGRFTLRSKKLIEFTKSIPRPNEYGNYTNEDTTIVIEYRNKVLEQGMKICPHTIARHFSVQTPIDDQVSLYNTFGFHGRDWKLEIVDRIIEERMKES